VGLALGPAAALLLDRRILAPSGPAPWNQEFEAGEAGIPQPTEGERF
jgi:hypothetical protein